MHFAVPGTHRVFTATVAVCFFFIFKSESESYYVAYAGLEHAILLPQLPTSQDYRSAPRCCLTFFLKIACYIVKYDLEVMIFLTLPTMCSRDYIHGSLPASTYCVQGLHT